MSMVHNLAVGLLSIADQSETEVIIQTVSTVISVIGLYATLQKLASKEDVSSLKGNLSSFKEDFNSLHEDFNSSNEDFNSKLDLIVDAAVLTADEVSKLNAVKEKEDDENRKKNQKSSIICARG